MLSVNGKGSNIALSLIGDGGSSEVWTYDDLHNRLNSLSSLLTAERKPLVFVLCGHYGSAVVSYLSCLRAGAAVCLLDGKLSQDLLQKLFVTYLPDIVLSDVEKNGPNDQAYSREDAFKLHKLFGWRRRISDKGSVHSDLAMLLPTSGTTGSPKMVRLSLANLESNARSIADYLAITCEERAVVSLPLHYSYGLSILNSHLRQGASLIDTGKGVLQPEFWQTFNEQGCTSFAGVPYQYQMLDRIGFYRFDLPFLRTMTQAGGRLKRELVEKFADYASKKNIRFFVMYGQTEATARISFVPPEKLAEKTSSVGLSIPGGKLLIDAAGKRSTEPGVRGEVVYEGPNVMLGYAETRAELALGDVQCGQLYTGDIGYLDQDGYLTLEGRSKRIAKLFGLRVNLDEVEAVFSAEIPVAAISADEKIVVFCENIDADQCRSFRMRLASQFKVNHNGFDVRSLSAIPTTNSGKIDYNSLKEALHAGT